MKKGMIAVTVMMLFSMAGVCHAVETEYGELGIDVDVTWVSKYIWRGFDKLDDKAAFQPSVNFNLFNTGFGFGVWSSFAGSSKDAGSVSTVNAEEWRYTLTYANSVLDGEAYKTNYVIGWVYYDFPDTASRDADMQEFFGAVSWPDICPFGVVPSYAMVYLWSAKGGGAARACEGAAHIFGLGYDLSVPGFLPDNPEQTLHFSWELVYNDGVGLDYATGRNVEHDWSNIVWGVSTVIDLPYGTLTPAVYYQTSMEKTVNTEDEFWCGLSYGLKF